MSLSPGLNSILATANCSDEKLRAFLIENGVTQPDSFGLLASSEGILESKVFPMLTAAGIDMNKLSTMIAVKKAWHLSRGQVDKDAATAAGKIPPPGNTEPIPAPQRRALTDTWLAKHNFVFGNDRLLTESLIGQLQRELSASPRRLSIYLIEGLRLQSSIQGPGKQVATISQGFLATEEIVADQVANHMELYTRMRAWFNTIALVTVGEEFFTYQDVIYIEDRLLALLQFTRDGRRPPIIFFTTAWATTQQTWSDEIRTTGKTLATLVKETASWAPVWTSWVPPAGGSSDFGQVPSIGNGSGKERELQNELDKARRWASEMQSQRDKARAAQQGSSSSHQRSRSRQAERGAQRESGSTGRQHHRQQQHGPHASSKSAGGKGGKGGKQQRRR